MDQLLGQYLTPMVMITGSRAETRELGRRVKELVAQPKYTKLISDVRSFDDVIPLDQPAKLRELEAIANALTPNILSRLTSEQRHLVEQMFSQAARTGISEQDLPLSITSGMREKDGVLDRAVLVYPRPTDANWKGELIQMLTRDLR